MEYFINASFFSFLFFVIIIIAWFSLLIFKLVTIRKKRIEKEKALYREYGLDMDTIHRNEKIGETQLECEAEKSDTDNMIMKDTGENQLTDYE